MSTPVIGTATDIPVMVNRGHIPMEVENESGFPFDDQDFDREGSYSFRSQLDDIAKRHPEFAKHLNFGNTFPFRSHTLGRHRRGSNSENPSGSQDAEFRRHAERPFGSRFEQFGFPFSRHFEDEPDFYYAEPQQHQAQQPQESQSPKEPSSPQPTTEKPPQAPHHSQERGRKQNIQQSNTVDLGQKQDPVDENRSQRSMSAPPENRSTGQRFVSSINIPIQRPGGGDMGARSSQPQPEAQTQSHPQTQNRPTERVIPIHVEGRDEPVIPKNVNTSQSAASPRPQAEKIFGRNPSHFTQFVNKGEPHGFTPEDAFRQQQQQQYQKQQQQNYQQPPPQNQPPPEQQIPTQQQQQQTPQPPKPIQLDQIQTIQKDVSELMNKVQNFRGKLRDKEYLYLDEMLTRNLIKLDNIETEGKENIRQARKEAIKCIEGCIGILEAKANANASAVNIAKQAEEEMEVEKPAESVSTSELPEQTASEQPPAASADLINAEKKHAVDTEVTSLEVSGVQRPGALIETAPMEIMPIENVAKEEVPSNDAVKTNPPVVTEEIAQAQTTPATTEEAKAEQVLEAKPESNQGEEVKAESMEVVPQDGTDEASQNLTKESETAAAQTETGQENKPEDKKEEKKEKKKGKKKEKTEKK